ncbi:MAG: hypothetical protein H0Z29_04025 [Candidatus Marinimicrobia bacterium]|nr:hypothetical protein [Candidatus Neomarinimicrobiota bacterium]
MRHKLFALLIIYSFIYTQVRIGEWKYITSKLSFNDLEILNDKIFAATSGGVISFDPVNNKFEIGSLSQELESYNFYSIKKDDKGFIWLAADYPFAKIYILDSKNLNINQVFDEYTWDKKLTAIKGFAFRENDAFVIFQDNVDWGLMYFTYNKLRSRWEYRELYKNFPIDIYRINNVSVINDTIYICTDNGLLYADLKNNTNLIDRNNWDIVPSTLGYKIQNIKLYMDKKLFNKYDLNANIDTLITTTDLAHYEIYNTIGMPIRNFNVMGDSILISTDRYFILIIANKTVSLFPGNNFTCSVVDKEGNIWAGSRIQALFKISIDGLVKKFIPNTTVTNAFSALYVDESGNLIAGSRKGISYISSDKIYNIVFYPYHKSIKNRFNLLSDTVNYFLADTLPAYFGSEGIINTIIKRGNWFYADMSHLNLIGDINEGGVLKFNFQNLDQYIAYDTTNYYVAGSEGKGGESSYVVLGRMTVDHSGNIWVCNQFAENDSVLFAITPDNRFIHFSISESKGALNYILTDIAIDNKNRVWVSSYAHTSETSPSSGGIAVLDHKNTLFDKSDDEWVWISTNKGLSSNNVYSVAFDKDNELWILTADGIQRAGVADNFPKKIFSYIESPVLTGIPFDKFSRIKIDNLGNKWITTSGAGVKLYTYEGIWYNNVEGFTSSNSGLLSDNIMDIAFYEPDGLVFFATSQGICVLKSEFGYYGEKYRKLKIFPSPYKIPSSEYMVIDGLLQGSEVKIFTIDGYFIRKLTKEDGNVIGSQAYWDGKDKHGNYVSSGVYLIMAYIREGQHTVEKIAIIKNK